MLAPVLVGFFFDIHACALKRCGGFVHGSVGLEAAYHHLYEYGTIPIFVTVGRIGRVPVVLEDGSVASRESFALRYTYDERVEDGFYAARALERLKALLEDPAQLAG